MVILKCINRVLHFLILGKRGFIQIIYSSSYIFPIFFNNVIFNINNWSRVCCTGSTLPSDRTFLIPILRKIAETELAVADAINIEKEIADKSNSKLVYMKLCSKLLLCRSNSAIPVELQNQSFSNFGTYFWKFIGYHRDNQTEKVPEPDNASCVDNLEISNVPHDHSLSKESPRHSRTRENAANKEKISKMSRSNQKSIGCQRR